MTVALLSVAWVAVVVGGAARVRPAPARVIQLRGTAKQRRPARRAMRGPVVRVVLAAVIPLPIVPAPLNVAVGVVFGAAMSSWPSWQRRRAATMRVARLEAELPEVVDLLVLAVGAGLTVPLALDAVARHGGELAGELGGAVAASRRGHRLADALDALPGRAGEPVRPLVAVLVASERYGAPITAGLERLAAEVRATRRRRADEAARKVSVKLLFPLVLCILPAFALLTVAPLIASALRSLRL